MKKKILLTLIFVLVFMQFSGCVKKPGETQTPPDEIIREDIADTDIVLAKDGVTNYSVVIPENAEEVEEYAAAELKEFFKKATGADIAVVTDAGLSFDLTKRYISLGGTVIKQQSGLTTDRYDLNHDGYKLKRYGNTLVIAGYMGRGTLYGVYKFLNATYGFKVYASDEIALTAKDVSYLKDFDLKDVPSFEGRFHDGVLDFNQQFQARMKMKNNQLSAKYGYGAGYEWMGMHCESFYHVLPPSVYNDPSLPDTYHPEWYQYSARQFCLTDNLATAEFIKNMKQIILDNPGGTVVNIGEEDLSGFCTCDECRASYSAYGYSGTVIRFANQVVEAIEEWLPGQEETKNRDLKYVIFAYNNTMAPPVNMNQQTGEITPKHPSLIPHEKLYIRYTPIMACFYHSFFDEICKTNESFALAFKGWKAITDNFMVWDYDVNYSAFFSFFDNYNVLQEVLTDYYENGVVNIMRQSSTGSTVNSMSDLDAYLNSELMWNVYADINVLIDDFMDNYYKSGAGYMKEYFNLMRTHLQLTELNYNAAGNQFHMGMYNTYSSHMSSASVWPKRILEQALSLFNKAYAGYDKLEDKQLAEKLKDRVLKESLIVRYLVLNNYSSYYNLNSPDYITAIDAYENDVRKLSAYSSSEGSGTMTWIKTLRDKV